MSQSKEKIVNDLVVLWTDVIEQLQFSGDKRQPIEIVASMVADEKLNAESRQRKALDIKSVIRVIQIAKNDFDKNAGEMWNYDGQEYAVAKAICQTFSCPEGPSVEDVYAELCLEAGNKERGDLLNSPEKEAELWRYAKAIKKLIGGGG